jgi:CDP-glycerol glycerophosphotransferase
MSSPQVVLLAAGKGTRLGRPLPKPLTVLADGRSILRQQVDNLRGVFGEQLPVTVVVGFRADVIVAAVPEVDVAYNHDFDTTNTSKSLLVGLLESRPGGVLWLNGDVVFDPALLHQLVPHLVADRTFVCVDTAVTADEEIKYTVDERGLVRELSKTVRHGLGEAVGINHVSSGDKALLVEHLRRCADDDYFERALETAIAEGLAVHPVDISGFSAVEVDVEEDLRRANLMYGPGAVAG